MIESNSAEASNELAGQSILTAKTNSLEGSDGADTEGFSDGDRGQESENVVNDEENNSNADRSEGVAGPEMSDANSSPSTSAVGTLSVKKTSGKGQKSKTRRFVGVRQRPSGRWVAEIKDSTQNIRLWLGTYDNAEDAAAAYDEAARALRGSNTRTNFGLPKDGRPELPSRAIRLLLQRAKATSAAKTNHFTFEDSNSVDYRASNDILCHPHQQVHSRPTCPKPQDGVILDLEPHFSQNKAMDYTLEADRSSCSVLSHPLSLNAMNSFVGQGTQGALGLSRRLSTGSTSELGTTDTEEKFTKAFIEMYTQLPSRGNAGSAEIYDDGAGGSQSGSSAGQTCSYGAANYNAGGARGGSMSTAIALRASGDHAHDLPGMAASVYKVNSEQQQNAGRMRQQLALPSAELDVGTGTPFGTLPTVYGDLTRKLTDYLQSSYSGPSSVLWQAQASSSADRLPPSKSSCQIPSVCPSFNASSFRQQEEAQVTATWNERESTSSYYPQADGPVSTPGLFRSISDSLQSPGVPFPSVDFLPQEASWNQTHELPVC